MQRLTILIYHRVLPAPDPILRLLPDRALFARQLDVVGRLFRVLPLTEAVRRLRAGQLVGRTACITFDDGYADNREVAFDILRAKGMPATFFVTTGYLDGGAMWNDRLAEALRAAPGSSVDLRSLEMGTPSLGSTDERRAVFREAVERFRYLPQAQRERCVDVLVAACEATIPRLMMTPGQVRELHVGGMEIGGHTVSHPILTGIEVAGARSEIAEGKRRLEAITGAPVRAFAYPNGRPGTDYSGAHVAMTREAGFELAVSTAPGVATPGTDVMQLPRFTPWPRSPVRLGLELIRNLWRTRPSLA